MAVEVSSIRRTRTPAASNEDRAATVCWQVSVPRPWRQHDLVTTAHPRNFLLGITTFVSRHFRVVARRVKLRDGAMQRLGGRVPGQS